MPKCANFSKANQRRSLAAAAETCTKVAAALRLLADDVPDHLLAVARLRLDNPQASLSQLGAMADPPQTKDTVIGRIRVLLAVADRAARAARTGAAR